MNRITQSKLLKIAAVFLVLSVAITFFTLRAINAPLRELTRGTRSIASGEFSHRIPATGPSEFAELARDFNSMSEKLGELDQMKNEELGYFEPRPWHRDNPQRPKVWDPGPTSNIWGLPPTPEFTRGR